MAVNPRQAHPVHRVGLSHSCRSRLRARSRWSHGELAARGFALAPAGHTVNLPLAASRSLSHMVKTTTSTARSSSGGRKTHSAASMRLRVMPPLRGWLHGIFPRGWTSAFVGSSCSGREGSGGSGGAGVGVRGRSLTPVLEPALPVTASRTVTSKLLSAVRRDRHVGTQILAGAVGNRGDRQRQQGGSSARDRPADLEPRLVAGAESRHRPILLRHGGEDVFDLRAGAPDSVMESSPSSTRGGRAKPRASKSCCTAASPVALGPVTG